MNILVTGSQGFIGKNLIAELNNKECGTIYGYDVNTDLKLLDQYCRDADFVFHLAGVNRPQDPDEFMEGNYEFTSILIDMLKEYGNPCPIMISSSTQALLDNPYGRSKKAGEDLLFDYSKETGAKALIYRFPNIFGKWSRPNYNSAIATFCHNIAHDLPIQVNDPEVVLKLGYIDDLVSELLNALEGRENRVGSFCEIPETHTIKLGAVVDLLYLFKNSRADKRVPDLSDEFAKKLYSTYLSFLPVNEFCYPLQMNIDQRGSFTEFLKTPDRGQVSVNVAKPGIVKGNHWHHSKTEKFLVVNGEGVVRFRRIDSDEVIEYFVSDKKLEVVDIPPGYTHNIENLGQNDMVTIMWANETYDPERPDTYYLEV